MLLPPIDRRFCVAPMLDCTDRHNRYFLRLISKHAVLYSEMVTTGALIHGDRERFLAYSQQEHPIALQLGGSNPEDLLKCTKLAEERRFDEVNLNIGCPSDRVQAGMIGACLMGHPDLVASCVETLVNSSGLHITVKCRIGIDDFDSYDFLLDFVGKVIASGCKCLIIHARKAILSGLSPKENREIPPLNYDYVYRLKRDFPDTEFIINGGITTLEQCVEHLKYVDGVMLGREAYQNPYILAEVDSLIYGDIHPTQNRLEILEQYYPYVEKELSKGVRLKHMSRHLFGLFHGLPGAKSWRRYLSENAYRPEAGVEVLEKAASLIQFP
ncbi:MAG: tRNA dihydrouridine(20/20a) synthase DusA [Pseudomonadales bacterium]|nr:tRNA dihydrouridine(20/20a) synthase DusA [Pseudomonadales bacterium]